MNIKKRRNICKVSIEKIIKHYNLNDFIFRLINNIIYIYYHNQSILIRNKPNILIKIMNNHDNILKKQNNNYFKYLITYNSDTYFYKKYSNYYIYI